MSAEDAESALLAARARAGDRAAYGSLYVRYFERVNAYMRLVLRDDHRAEDAAQQVFVKALEALPRYEAGSSPFRAWLFAIARNRALDELTELRRPRPVETVEAVGVDDGGTISGLPWISDSRLTALIGRLPLAQQQVLLLRYLADLTATQIGELLGISAVNVRALHSRALRYLRERLIASEEHAPRGSARSQRMGRLESERRVVNSRRRALTG